MGTSLNGLFFVFMIKVEYQIPTDFDAYRCQDLLYQRGWKDVELVKASNYVLRKVDKRAAWECADGRFDQLTDRKMRGYRSFGQVNGLMALKTGGDLIGLAKADILLFRSCQRTGSHGPTCAMYELWKEGALETVVHKFNMPVRLLGKLGWGEGRFIKAHMELIPGKHFSLNGDHVEGGMTINPIYAYTEEAFDGSRFRVDDPALAQFGIPFETRMNFNAELVEKAKPDAANKAEIIVP